MNEKLADLEQAILYGMRHGIFHPVPEPKPPYTTKRLIRWGAKRNFHRAVAEYFRDRDARAGERGDTQG